MKAIILSAGQGSRLGHMVDGRPKCLIEFNGRTFWTLDISGDEWSEVDFPPDVEATRELTARWDANEKAAAA